MTGDLEITALGPGDEARVRAAARLFDKPLIAAATTAFLQAPDHHLLVAWQGGEPAGFVSGVETTHPDKGTEMFLYELGVDEAFRGRGIGAALVSALADLGRQRGCYGMWVLTSPDNEAGIATYRRAGASTTPATIMLEWRFVASDNELLP
jgi:ribosomal protein S18 acetylase RimI-like enzyme